MRPTLGAHRTTRAPYAPGVAGDLDALLTDWAAEHLGSGIDQVLFRAGYFSDVVGIALKNGSRAVIKIRPAQARLAHCAQVQEALRGAGFPAAELLVAPTHYVDGRVASAEALVEQAAGRGTPEASARLLADQVALSPALPAGVLAPSPAWVRWDHDEHQLWPTPDDREVDLNAARIDWIDAAAATVRDALVSRSDEPVVGHVDWTPQNVWWNDDGSPLVVHDWDSLALLPEPAVAGVAAAIFVENATADDTARFLQAYAAAAGGWTPDQEQQAWAAGLWVRLFDAKKDLVAGRRSSLDEQDVRQRLARAGV